MSSVANEGQPFTIPSGNQTPSRTAGGPEPGRLLCFVVVAGRVFTRSSHQNPHVTSQGLEMRGSEFYMGDDEVTSGEQWTMGIVLTSDADKVHQSADTQSLDSFPTFRSINS